MIKRFSDTLCVCRLVCVINLEPALAFTLGFASIVYLSLTQIEIPGILNSNKLRLKRV